MNTADCRITSSHRNYGLSASTIKWFAIACMFADHVAWAFLPTFSALGFTLHAFGRITAPCMCYFIVEGYSHTHSVQKYLLRLGVFALISWPCFSFYETGTLTFRMGMIWSLFFALLAVCAFDKISNPVLKLLGVLICAVATQIGDWPIFCVVFTLIFWIFRGSFRAQALVFAGAAVIMAVGFSYRSLHAVPFTLMQLCVLLALIPLVLYNGRRGGESCPQLNKWAFYVFYPAHLLLLGLIKYIVL